MRIILELFILSDVLGTTWRNFFFSKPNNLFSKFLFGILSQDSKYVEPLTDFARTISSVVLTLIKIN